MADDQTRYINPALWATPAASELTDSAKERTELMVIQAEKLTTKGEPSG